MSIEVAFSILGRVQIRVGGQLRARWAQPRLHGIMAALLTQPERPVSYQSLLGWAWPEGRPYPQRVESTFQTYARRVREALSIMDVPVSLDNRGGALTLHVDKGLIDYHRSRTLMHQAQLAAENHDYQRARDTAEDSLALWQPEGPLFGIDTERARNWRQRVTDNEWLPANYTLIHYLAQLGQHDEALARLSGIEDAAGSELTFMKHKLRVLHLLGRTGERTAYYFTARKTLSQAAEQEAADDIRAFHDQLAGQPAGAGRTTGALSPEPAAPTGIGHARLPVDVGDFVGRGILLAKLHGVATDDTGHARPTCIVLDGPPAVGKTTLATHWAHQELGHLVRNAIYLDLYGFSGERRIDADEAASRLLSALDYPTDRPLTATRRHTKLSELLTAEHTMIVLDNVVNSAHVRPLLAALSRSIVVVISRQRLTGLTAAHGVRHITVQPLHHHDAIELFTRLIDERADLSSQSVAELAMICAGSPLAVQLVAHYINDRPGVPLRQTITELADRSRLLELGDDGDDPQANLRIAFSQSYVTLPPEEQRLFRALGLHPGPEFSAQAAAALTGQRLTDIQHSLERLRGGHLIQQVDGPSRYRMHDLLRVFAAELAAGEAGPGRFQAQTRMLSFYLHSAYNSDRCVFPYRPPVPMFALEADVVPAEFGTDDVATEWMLRERDNLVALAQRAVTDGRHEYVWRLPHTWYGVFRRYGYYDELIAAYEAAIDAVMTCGDAESEGGTRTDLGLLCLAIGDHTRANEQLQLAAAIAQRTGSEIGCAVSQKNLATLFVAIGQYENAVRAGNRALHLAIETHDQSLQSAIIHQMGEIFRHQARYGQAIVEYQQAFLLREITGNRHGQAQTSTELAAAHCELGQFDTAEAYCQRALNLVEAIHDIEVAPRAFGVMASIHLHRKDYEATVRYARTAVRLARSARTVPVEAKALDTLAAALYATSFHDAAEEGWLQARNIYRDLGDSARADSIEARLAELAAHPRVVPQARSHTPVVGSETATNTTSIGHASDLNSSGPFRAEEKR
ncbi:MAG TPA: tetratricopeptide repeat protein [Pseudonocardiaceae bacterium]